MIGMIDYKFSSPIYNESRHICLTRAIRAEYFSTHNSAQKDTDMQSAIPRTRRHNLVPVSNYEIHLEPEQRI